MSAAEFGSFSLLLFLLISVPHVFGHLFTRLGQPRVVGEILAGVVIGPSVLGQIAPALSAAILPIGDAAGADAQEIAIPGGQRIGILCSKEDAAHSQHRHVQLLICSVDRRRGG